MILPFACVPALVLSNELNMDKILLGRFSEVLPLAIGVTRVALSTASPRSGQR
jgi:hypothetical protein